MRDNYTKKELYITFEDSIKLFTCTDIPKNACESATGLIIGQLSFASFEQFRNLLPVSGPPPAMRMPRTEPGTDIAQLGAMNERWNFRAAIRTIVICAAF